MYTAHKHMWAPLFSYINIKLVQIERISLLDLFFEVLLGQMLTTITHRYLQTAATTYLNEVYK